MRQREVACRSTTDDRFVAIGPDLPAVDPETDLTERCNAGRLREDEAMLVRERLLDTRPGGRPLRRKLDPRPDQAIDATARYPALKGGEGSALTVLGNLKEGGGAVGAREVAAKDDAARRDRDCP